MPYRLRVPEFSSGQPADHAAPPARNGIISSDPLDDPELEHPECLVVPWPKGVVSTDDPPARRQTSAGG